MKGVLAVIQTQLIDKLIFKSFFQWKNKVDCINYEIINLKIEKYYMQKKKMSLHVFEKIVQKINLADFFHKQLFFERLTLNLKLKNSLKDYGFSYKKIPFLLNDDNKGFCLSLRDTYSKTFWLMRISILLSKKKYGIIFDKYNKVTVADNFKLNNCLLKWKKFTLDSISRPYKTILKISDLINLYNNRLRLYFNTFLNKLKRKNNSLDVENKCHIDYNLRALIYLLHNVKKINKFFFRLKFKIK